MEDGIYEVNGQPYKVEGGKTYKLGPMPSQAGAGQPKPPTTMPPRAGAGQPQPTTDGMWIKGGKEYKKENGNLSVRDIGVLEDLGRTAGPAAIRSAVGAATAIPTVLDLPREAAEWGYGKLFGPPSETTRARIKGALNPVQTAIELPGQAMQWGYDKLFGPPSPELQAAREKLSRAPTYGNVMGTVENLTGPLYEPQTTPGKILDIGTGVALPLATGNVVGAVRSGTASLPNLIRGARNVAKTSLIGGAGTHYGGEAGEAAGRAITGSETGANVGRVVGGLGGGMAAASQAPRISPLLERELTRKIKDIPEERLAARQRLESGMPGLRLTAGQVSGDPVQLQREANAATFRSAPQWAKGLPGQQQKAMTQRAAESMGYGTDPSGRPVQSLGPRLFGEADTDLLRRERELENRYNWQFNPYDPLDPSVPKSAFERGLEETLKDANRNMVRGSEPREVFRGRYEEIIPPASKTAAAKTLPAGQTGSVYTKFRRELGTDIKEAKTEHLENALRDLRNKIDDQMSESIIQKGGDPNSFNEIRRQIQNRKILMEPGVVDPATGRVNPQAWSAGFENRTKPGQRVLDPATHQLTQDVGTLGVGTPYQPYRDPSSHIVGKTLAGTGALLGGGVLGNVLPGYWQLAGLAGVPGAYGAAKTWGALAPRLPLPKPLQSFKAKHEFSPYVQEKRLGRKLPLPEADMPGALSVLFGSTPALISGR